MPLPREEEDCDDDSGDEDDNFAEDNDAVTTRYRLSYALNRMTLSTSV